MACDELRDLELAGVQWEINEVPTALAAQFAAAMVGGAAPAMTAPANIAAPTTTSTTPSPIIAPNAPQRTPTSVVPPIAPVQPISVDTAVAMAARPGDMNALCRMIAEFNHPLRAGATNVVLPHMAPKPCPMIIVTDMPGSDDDATGQILSGPAGELMDKMLNAIGLSRDVVSIVPLLFWRTPGGRTPTDAETELARPFAMRAIELLRPRVILTLGTMAATQIAGVQLGRGHGTAITRDDGTFCMPIYHPNYLLLKPGAKRDVWTALQNVQNLLKTLEN